MDYGGLLQISNTENNANKFESFKYRSLLYRHLVAETDCIQLILQKVTSFLLKITAFFLKSWASIRDKVTSVICNLFFPSLSLCP